MKTHVIYIFFFALSAIAQSVVAAPSTDDSLRRYADDYRLDPTATTITIGFLIGDERWLLEVRENDNPPHDVTLTKGFPEYPIVYWELTRNTFERIARGMTGETATARSRADDPRLMVLKGTENFPWFMWTQDFQTKLSAFKLHFFATGIPEIIPLEIEHAVGSHGQSAIGIYYAPKLSTFWTYTAPGQKVNFEAGLDVNEQHSIVIPLRGRGMAEIGGNELAMEVGTAIFIPADVTHRFWNPYDEPVESFAIIYGNELNE